MRLALVVSLLLVPIVAGCGSRPGSVEGRAVSRGEGVPGASVEFYVTSGKEKGSTPFATAGTAADGSFRLQLPAGRYWVMVRDLAGSEGPRRVAEYPGNPVPLAAGQIRKLGDVELQTVGRAQESAGPPGAGIRGRVLHDGAPAGEAAVMVYGPAAARLAGPGYLALARTDVEGRFQIDLAPGPYRLAARRRRSGAASGYLQQGDLSATAPKDPLVVPAEGYLDLGDLVLHEVDAGRMAAEGPPGVSPATGTAVEGRVVGPDGKPRGGQFVFIYKDEAMIGRPEAMGRTGEDGTFALALPGGGKYYFGARSRHGGPRQPGEWAGRLAGTPDSGLEVPAGQRVKGLTIAMEQVW